MGDDNERPGNLAAYGAGLIALPFGCAVLLCSSFSTPAADPSDAIINMSIAIGGPIMLLAFGLLSALPRRRRDARLRASHTRAALVNVIITPAAKRELGLEDALKRSYTATFLFESGAVTLWKGGVRPKAVATFDGSTLATRTTSMRHASNRVAAIELSFASLSVVLPVVKSGGVFNMATGYDNVEKIRQSIE